MAELRAQDKLAVISSLGTMLTAGIPMTEAIEIMSRDSKAGMKKILQSIHDDLDEGKSLSQALTASGAGFDAVVVNMIKGAEAAGTLATTLQELTKSLQKSAHFSSKLRASLTYPIFVMGVFVFVIVLILTFAIPRVAKVFDGLRVDMPLATEIIITISQWFLASWPFILLGLGLITVSIAAFWKRHRLAMVSLVLRLPGLRTLGWQIDLARFTGSLGMMLRAGLPIADALELAEGTVNKKEARQLLASARAQVIAGKPLSVGLKQAKGSDALPLIMLRTIEAAEESGTLEATMREMGAYFEEQVDARLRTLSTLIEPVMIVAIGIAVGGIMLAVIAPIYNLITQINVR